MQFEHYAVLDRNDPLLSLSAAYVCRELGLFDNALPVSKTIYDIADSPIKKNAALVAYLR